MNGTLGRRTSKTWEHIDKYPLSALATTPVAVPVALGINWYVEFDKPAKDSKGRYWVAKNGKLTAIRGGHCICLPHATAADYLGWWGFYDQGAEGACVGFGSSRVMSILNRHRYYARWLWDMAKATDEWTDSNPGDDNGTSVRAAMEILRAKGHVPWQNRFDGENYSTRDLHVANSKWGIKEYRWARTADEVKNLFHNTLYNDLGGVPFINSWGKTYPHFVWMTWEVLERLIHEGGEAAIVTDR